MSQNFDRYAKHVYNMHTNAITYKCMHTYHEAYLYGFLLFSGRKLYNGYHLFVTQHFNLDKEEEMNEFPTGHYDITEFTGAHVSLAILLVVGTTFLVLWWLNRTTRDCRTNGMYNVHKHIYTLTVNEF